MKSNDVSTPPRNRNQGQKLQEKQLLSNKKDLFGSNKENVLTSPLGKKYVTKNESPQKVLENSYQVKLDKKNCRAISKDIAMELLGLIFSNLKNNYVLLGSVNVFLRNKYLNEHNKYMKDSSNNAFGDIDICCLHNLDMCDPREKVTNGLNKCKLYWDHDGVRNLLISYKGEVYSINLVYSQGDEEAFPIQFTKDKENEENYIDNIDINLNGKTFSVPSFNDIKISKKSVLSLKDNVQISKLPHFNRK